jgi:hypothetical protein
MFRVLACILDVCSPLANALQDIQMRVRALLWVAYGVRFVPTSCSVVCVMSLAGLQRFPRNRKVIVSLENLYSPTTMVARSSKDALSGTSTTVEVLACLSFSFMVADYLESSPPDYTRRRFESLTSFNVPYLTHNCRWYMRPMQVVMPLKLT